MQNRITQGVLGTVKVYVKKQKPQTTIHLPLRTVQERLSNSDKLRLSFEVLQLQLWDANSSAVETALQSGLGVGLMILMLRIC